MEISLNTEFESMEKRIVKSLENSLHKNNYYSKPNLSRKEAAEYISVSLTTLWRLTYMSLQIPCVKVSRRKVIYQRVDLDKYIQKLKFGKHE